MEKFLKLQLKVRELRFKIIVLIFDFLNLKDA